VIQTEKCDAKLRHKIQWDCQHKTLDKINMNERSTQTITLKIWVNTGTFIIVRIILCNVLFRTLLTHAQATINSMTFVKTLF